MTVTDGQDSKFWRQNKVSVNCANVDCQRFFTEEHRGLSCSGCKAFSYCNSVCQKADWKRHKFQCKERQEDMRLQSASLPLQQRRPNVRQDLLHFLGMASQSLRMGARTMLKLGRPDSLARTHFLVFQLNYRQPPVERWSLTDPKTPQGDERQLFDFVKFLLKPDANLSMCGSSAEDKAAAWAQLNPNESLVTVVLQVAWTNGRSNALKGGPLNDDGSEPVTLVTDMTVPHGPYEAMGLPLADRVLNSNWFELVKAINKCPVPRNFRENQRETGTTDLLDLAMSEELETLQRLPISPAEGWAAMKARAAQFPGCSE